MDKGIIEKIVSLYGSEYIDTTPEITHTVPKVVIKSISGSSKWRDWIEQTEVYVDGERLEEWCNYGGDPEDNSRNRDYRWVEPLLKKLAESLGAEVTIEVEDRGERDDW